MNAIAALMALSVIIGALVGYAFAQVPYLPDVVLTVAGAAVGFFGFLTVIDQ